MKKKMEEKMEIPIYEPQSQLIFGERGVKIVVTIRDAEEIAKRTGGKIYFDSDGELYARSGYFTVRKMISEGIRDIALAEAERTKNKEITINPDELDWRKIEKAIQECDEKIREEEEAREKEKQVKSILQQKFKHVKAEKYSDVVVFRVDGERIHEIDYDTNDDLLKKLSEITEEDVLVAYIKKLKEKCEELQIRCDETEKEIIKRYYDEGKEITIERPVETTLRVIADDDC